MAGVNALMRAQESERPPPERVLEDPWAERLGETHWLVRALRGASGWLPPLDTNLNELVTAHVVRHASIDALVLRALDAGYRQVVLIGAGYDMRASRFGPPEVRWFEVDQPAVLARKQALLEGAEGLSPSVVRVAVDLSRTGLAEALGGAGFSEDQASVFVAEGLVHYLPRRAVEDLVDQVGAGSGARRLVLSYITPTMVPRASPTFRWLVRSVREIPDTFFSAEELQALAEERGFEGFRSWSFAEQVEDFAPQAVARRVGVSQEVAELRRGR